MSLNVYIIDRHFNTILIKTNETTTIGNFKKEIYNILNDLEPELMDLFHNNEKLNDNITFRDLKIENKNEIIIECKLKQNNVKIIRKFMDDEKTIDISIEPTDSIYGIKYKIYEKDEKYPLESFDLYINNENEILEDYNCSVMELKIFNIKKMYLKIRYIIIYFYKDKFFKFLNKNFKIKTLKKLIDIENKIPFFLQNLYTNENNNKIVLENDKEFLNNNICNIYLEQNIFFIIIFNYEKITLKLDLKSSFIQLKKNISFDFILKFYDIKKSSDFFLKLTDIYKNELNDDKTIEDYEYKKQDFYYPIYIYAKFIINITISYDNKSYNFLIYPFDDIKTLKTNIHKELNIPILEQILKLDNLILENNKTFIYYCQMNNNKKIKNKYEIELFRKKIVLIENFNQNIYEIKINKKKDLKQEILKLNNLNKNSKLFYYNIILNESCSLSFYQYLMNLDIIILTFKND